MGFRSLRVINDDIVQPDKGFGTHPHRDMEIISIVVDGALEHRDSTGSGSVITPGEVQRMSAGTGIMHSEQNSSTLEEVHFLQIWITPGQLGLEPGYEQKAFPQVAPGNGLQLIGSRDGSADSLTIHQDVLLYRAKAVAGEQLFAGFEPGRSVWLQMIDGSVLLGDSLLNTGDGAAIKGVEELSMTVKSDSDLLVFDLA
jgi:redox-sensitive bicupin YhaK (pirin superfamily)